mmetsp:Transcript_14235/g.22165  ORF Transcript_14235/g.22165 Transcript_14235/m.22165 type:complete len:96 (+) Transcript_14235:262-549(+)
MDLGPHNHESHSVYYSEEADDEFMAQDNLAFEEFRKAHITSIEDISKLLRHQRNMKKIKKECMKHMVAGPSLLEESLLRPKQHKNSMASKGHKNS